VTCALRYLFSGLSEGAILALCVLFSKGHTTLTNHLSISDKKQVIFIGLWLFVSVFLNDLFRGFFLFSLIIAYICLSRIVVNRCAAAALALRAGARNARSLNNNAEGAKRMELKAVFFRSLVLLLVVYVTCVCVVLIIIAFVPYVKEAYIGSYLIKDVLLFLTFTLVTVVPRVLQWRFNYTLEHEIANQMPHNDNLGNGILAGIFEQRNFRLVPAFFRESCSLPNHTYAVSGTACELKRCRTGKSRAPRRFAGVFTLLYRLLTNQPMSNARVLVVRAIERNGAVQVPCSRPGHGRRRPR
jgi:hypothetical protein